jgi:hypothetical protein
MSAHQLCGEDDCVMQSLLTLMVTWLSINFGLPAVYDHPRVEFVSAAELAQIRYGRLAALRNAGAEVEQVASGAPKHAGDVHAFYDDTSRSIYLPKEWAGRTPAELSVLVHEMVHHLQLVGGHRFECPQAREKMAYTAQQQWLNHFGRSLETEFEIDPMTLLLRTKCMF